MMGRRIDPNQPGLFGEDPIPQLAKPDDQIVSLGEALPRTIHLGTSSWSFPGWRGIVWEDETTESLLAREGLRAYARHPLLRTVGVDKTYYRPAPRGEFERLRAQVPADFRFLVKAHDAITRRDVDARSPNSAALWLDCAYAIDHVVEPISAGLGENAGPILFQFSHMNFRGVAAAESFIRCVGKFIGGLPVGPLYAIEVRDRILVRPSWAAMLRDSGATHCFNAHPTQPTPIEQSRVIDPATQRALVGRWMLGSNMSYGGAIDRYEPFDKIVDADPATRDQFAQLCLIASQAERHAFVIINNKAEGSAPRSVELLARTLVERSRATSSFPISQPSHNPSINSTPKEST